jgi:hypothetical protein
MLGTDTSPVEVTNVSKHGIWLLLNEEEVFLPFEKFPWFRDAPVGKIMNVEFSSEQHLYWPELDIDLEVDSVLNPDRYPLVSRVLETGEGYQPLTRSATAWDQKKIDNSVLALLQLTLHDGDRAWKGFDFEVMDRLFQKGYILDPANKNKSVVLTATGLAHSKELFDRLYGAGPDQVKS